MHQPGIDLRCEKLTGARYFWIKYARCDEKRHAKYALDPEVVVSILATEFQAEGQRLAEERADEHKAAATQWRLVSDIKHMLFRAARRLNCGARAHAIASTRSACIPDGFRRGCSGAAYSLRRY